MNMVALDIVRKQFHEMVKRQAAFRPLNGVPLVNNGNGNGVVPAPLSVGVFNPPPTQTPNVVVTPIGTAPPIIPFTGLGSSTDGGSITTDSSGSTISATPSSTTSAPSTTGVAGAANGSKGQHMSFLQNKPLSITVIVVSSVVGLLLIFLIVWWCMRRRRYSKLTPSSSTDLLQPPGDVERGPIRSGSFGSSVSGIGLMSEVQPVYTSGRAKSPSAMGNGVTLPRRYQQTGFPSTSTGSIRGRQGLPGGPQHARRPSALPLAQPPPAEDPFAILAPPQTPLSKQGSGEESPVYGLHDHAPPRALPKAPFTSPQLPNPYDAYAADTYVSTPIVDLPPPAKRSPVSQRKKKPPGLRPLNLRADLSPLPITSARSPRSPSFFPASPMHMPNTLNPAMALMGGFGMESPNVLSAPTHRKSMSYIPLSPTVPATAFPTVYRSSPSPTDTKLSASRRRSATIASMLTKTPNRPRSSTTPSSSKSAMVNISIFTPQNSPPLVASPHQYPLPHSANPSPMASPRSSPKVSTPSSAGSVLHAKPLDPHMVPLPLASPLPEQFSETGIQPLIVKKKPTRELRVVN